MNKSREARRAEAHSLAAAARLALKHGQFERARKLAKQAIQLDPHWEVPWLMLAAAAEPAEALRYVARALELNPRSRTARRAVRWCVRRLPPEARRGAIQRARLPQDMRVPLAPMEALTRRKLLSARLAVPAFLLAGLFGFWWNGKPVDAHQFSAAAQPVAKASLTPTPTNTPTNTPTATPTATPTPSPTPTNTPQPTPTATRRPNVSWNYTLNPETLADEGRWIDVDISEQKVTAYEGATPVRTFIVSTGTAQHPTVLGQFRIWIKLRYTDMAGPGYYLPDVPYTMYFYRGYALHGTYWHDNFGTPMSHGCVNLRTEDAKWLFNFASVGTLVNVHP